MRSRTQPVASAVPVSAGGSGSEGSLSENASVGVRRIIKLIRNPVVLTVTLGTALSIAGFFAQCRWADHLERTRFEAAAENRASSLKRELSSEIAQLAFLRQFVAEAPPSARQDLLRSAAAARQANGSAVSYTWIEPEAADAPCDGFEAVLASFSDVAVQSVLSKACETGTLAASARLRPGAGDVHSYSILLAAPVYSTVAIPASVSERRRKLRGFIAAVVSTAEILERGLKYLRPYGIDVYLFDRSAPAEEAFLYYHPSRRSPVRVATSFAYPPPDRPHYTSAIPFGGREWEVRCVGIPEAVDANLTWESWGVLLLGLAVTASAAAFLHLLMSRAHRVEHLVAIRTKELSESNRQLAAARDAALEASELKSQFLANMSHEIRTPMNGIIGFTQLALATNLDAEQKDYLETVELSANALLKVINDILDFSKIEAGCLDIDAAPFSLCECVEGAVKTLSSEAAQKGIALHCHISSRCPDEVVGDATRLRQVLLNLLGNAIKFTDRGSVRVEVSTGCAATGTLTAYFRVSDTGSGIPHDKQKLIFEAFRQVDGSSTRRHGGTGLGLAITARIIDLMKGRIWVESEEGRGSTFHFTVPLAWAEQPDDVSGGDTNSQDPVADPLSILVAEDNAISQELMSLMLKQWGHQVAVAANGRDVLELLGRRTFDLILMDVQMPEVDGFQATAEIRRRDAIEGTHTLIVALTAHALKGDRERCLAAGMDGYLAKPVDSGELMAVIAEYAARRTAVAGA